MQIVQEKVLNNERLYQVKESQMRHAPHSLIGALTFQCGFSYGYGTAFFISKDLILTAAHNCFDKLYNKECTNFKFYHAAGGAIEDFYQIEAWRMMPQFKRCNSKQSFQYDFALMKIKTNPRKKPLPNLSFLMLEPICQDCDLKKMPLSIFGYPFDQRIFPNYKPANKTGKKIELFQYGLEAQKRVAEVSISESRIKYMMSTFRGQSGAPVVSNGSIIGIHIGGADRINVGRLITLKTIQQLQKWCNQLKGEAFLTRKHIGNQNHLFHSKLHLPPLSQKKKLYNLLNSPHAETKKSIQKNQHPGLNKDIKLKTMMIFSPKYSEINQANNKLQYKTSYPYIKYEPLKANPELSTKEQNSQSFMIKNTSTKYILKGNTLKDSSSKYVGRKYSFSNKQTKIIESKSIELVIENQQSKKLIFTARKQKSISKY